jgi:hydrogenase-4 transcriptional activator
MANHRLGDRLAHEVKQVTGNREGLLLRLWAEASNHDTLQESLPLFLREILDHVPLAELRIEAVQPDQHELLTLAKWTASAGMDAAHRASGIDAASMPALLRWAGEEACALHEPGQTVAGPFRHLTDIDRDRTYLLAPLVHRSGMLSLVRFVSHPFENFLSLHQQVLTEALPPLSAIIENDQRLREIQRLGAAAEADKQVLLLRLGRESMGDTIVGIDSGLQAVMQRAAQVATTDASVLLLGETGSGKEVIARAVHERSLRTSGPFVRVNCGALPPDLIDSELFGPRERQFHRRAGQPPRLVRARGRRHVVSRRGRRTATGSAGAVAARATGRDYPAGGQRARHPGRRPLDRRHAQGFAADGAGRPFPRGLVVPAGGLPDHHPAAARTP